MATDFGGYIIPDYNAMTDQQRSYHREMLKGKMETHNMRWGKRLKQTIDVIGPEEDLTVAHLRYSRALKMLSAKKGADYYKYFLIGGWIALEFIAIKLNIKALGYTQSQMKLYEIYETYLIEMGELHGFGENWPPWVKILLISLGNLVVLVLLNHFFGGMGTEQAMAFLSGFISGDNRSFSMGESKAKGKKRATGKNKQSEKIELIEDEDNKDERADEADDDLESSEDMNPLQSILGTFGGGDFDLSSMVGMMTNMFAGMQQQQQPAKEEPQPTPEARRAGRAKRRAGPKDLP